MNQSQDTTTKAASRIQLQNVMRSMRPRCSSLETETTSATSLLPVLEFVAIGVATAIASVAHGIDLERLERGDRDAEVVAPDRRARRALAVLRERLAHLVVAFLLQKDAVDAVGPPLLQRRIEALPALRCVVDQRLGELGLGVVMVRLGAIGLDDALGLRGQHRRCIALDQDRRSLL